MWDNCSGTVLPGDPKNNHSTGSRERIEKKRGAERRLFAFIPALLHGLGEPALVPGRGVLVDESLPRCAIQEFHRRQFFLDVSTCGRALERGAKRGSLGSISDRGGARFPHVLLR